MNKLQELEAARNLEPDCDYGAVGAGRYRAHGTKETIRVLVRVEDGDDRIWVAVGLEKFIASQSPRGGSWMQALDDLGHMFDADDATRVELATAGHTVMACQSAPADIVDEWNRGIPIGVYSLGQSRRADVREPSKVPADFPSAA